MSYAALAFFTGLFGSLHCVSMCGPLILALPFATQNLWMAILQRLLYQAGRIMMYGLIGLLIGFVGAGFQLLGLQQIISAISGAMLLGIGVNYFLKEQKKSANHIPSRIIQILTSLLGKYLSKPYGGFIAGALNGLLPCGITYIALAQAINLDTAVKSGSFMLFFGLGTVPLLFLTAISPLFFRKFKTPAILVPILFMLAGSFLIARGLNLEIPYISHKVDMNAGANCN